MPATLSLNEFLHSASLLLEAYPTSRITTKYSLPRPPKPDPRTTSQNETATVNGTNLPAAGAPQRERREPSATLTVKVFHAGSGICLKYTTDKAQEVGRLITSLGRLARGETIELPSTTTGNVGGGDGDAAPEKMEVDSGTQVAVKGGDASAVSKPSGGQGTQQQQQGQGGGGGGGGAGGKKKKGKGKR